jgi:hypothetical protein
VTYCDYVANEMGNEDPNCETDHSLTNQIMKDGYAKIATKNVIKYFDSKKFKDSWFNSTDRL